MDKNIIPDKCPHCGYKHNNRFSIVMLKFILREDNFGNIKFDNKLNWQFLCVKCAKALDFMNDEKIILTSDKDMKSKGKFIEFRKSFISKAEGIHKYMVSQGARDFDGDDVKDISKEKDESLLLSFRLNYQCLHHAYSSFIDWKVKCGIILNEIKKRGLKYEDKYSLFKNEWR